MHGRADRGLGLRIGADAQTDTRSSPPRRLSRRRARRYRAPMLHAAAAVLLLVGALVALHLPLLHELAGMLSLDTLAYSWDAYTHYLRATFAREYYLPSGHHWGWDPFWFQGYVPFLLYPHLHYVVIGLVSGLLPVAPMRTFNAVTLATLYLWPLLAGLLVVRRRGIVATLAIAVWIGTVSSTYGGGVRGLLLIGLLSQQIGLAVFTVFCWELLVRCDVARAGLWLGLPGVPRRAARLGRRRLLALRDRVALGQLRPGADRLPPRRHLDGLRVDARRCADADPGRAAARGDRPVGRDGRLTADRSGADARPSDARRRPRGRARARAPLPRRAGRVGERRGLDRGARRGLRAPATRPRALRRARGRIGGLVGARSGMLASPAWTSA